MKKGFTLVEVIAIVAILAVITLLVVPRVNNTIKNNKKKVCDGIVKTIEDAASSYAYLHINEMPTTGSIEITLQELMQEDLLQNDLENPYTHEKISKSNTVRITKNENNYEFAYTGDDCK